MEAQLALIVGEGRGKFMRPMDATAIDDHDDLFASFAKDAHDLMNILAQLLGVTMGHELIEDPRRAILDGSDHTEQDATGDATPGAILGPRLTFETFFASDLALAQRTEGQPRALGAAPPAQSGEGKAPQDRFIFVEQNNVTTARAVLQGREGDRAISEVGRGGIEAAGGATVG
jgi:hypothetical protein